MLFSLNPKQIAVDGTRAIAFLTRLADTAERVFDFKQLAEKYKRMKLGRISATALATGVAIPAGSVSYAWLTGYHARQRDLIYELYVAQAKYATRSPTFEPVPNP